jgi:hypothetical protein
VTQRGRWPEDPDYLLRTNCRSVPPGVGPVPRARTAAKGLGWGFGEGHHIHEPPPGRHVGQVRDPQLVRARGAAAGPLHPRAV